MLEEQDQNNEGLTGSDRKIWGLEERRKNRPRDLVSLRPRTYEDGFSKLVSDKLVPFAHTFYNPKVDEQLGFTASDDATVHEATRIFTIVVASLLPYVSIVILHVVKSMAKKLGILGGSSLLFSLSVSILTSASRAEVFAVTTALVLYPHVEFDQAHRSQVLSSSGCLYFQRWPRYVKASRDGW